MGLRKLGRNDAFLALSAFFVALTIYIASPIISSLDSKFAIHVATSIYQGHYGELSPWQSALRKIANSKTKSDGLPRHVRATPNGIYSIYPIGTSLIALPFVVAEEALRSDTFSRLEDGTLPKLEQRIAAIIAAAAVGILYLALRRRGASTTAALLAIVAFALGTSMWSIASRALWQHGPLILCFTAAIFFLSRKPLRAVDVAAAGLALGYAVVVRQTAGIALITIGLALVCTNWRYALIFGASAIAPMLILIAYDVRSFDVFGNPYTQMFMRRWTWSWTGFAGLMIAPSRGLLVFSPILLFAVYGFLRVVSKGHADALDIAYAAYVLLLWLFIACWPGWKGGHTYGPRQMSDALPFLMLYVAVAWDDLAVQRGHAPAIARATFLTLMAISGLIHYRGAFNFDVYVWNGFPDLPTRVWSVTSPQFLYGLQNRS